MTNNILLAPPFAFIILLAVFYLLSRLLSRLSFRPAKHTAGEGKAYACGEDNYNNTAHPDYSQFFPFAFFFTLAHVAALMMTTVPKETIFTFVVAFLYIGGAITGLFILIRK